MAPHIAAAVVGGTFANLSVSRIDPVAETAKYSAKVMSNGGGGLDEQRRSRGAIIAEAPRS